jgi:hypothetical protein
MATSDSSDSDSEWDSDDESSLSSAESCFEYIDVDTPEVEQEATNQWQPVQFSGKIEVLLDNVDEDLVRSLELEGRALAKKLDDEIKTFSTEDLEAMPSDEVKYFNCFAGSELWNKLLAYMNKNRSSSVSPFTPTELEHFIRLLMWLSVYRTTIEDAMESPEDFPRVNSAIFHLKGVDRAKSMLRSLKISSTQHTGSSWQAVFTTNRDLQEFEEIISKRLSRLAFTQGVTDLVIDDEKMRNRSSKSAHFGWSRSKGILPQS